MSRVTLDIIIVSYNTREHVLECLESIRTNPPSVSWKVTIVDNASDDGTAEAIRVAFPHVTTIGLEKNVGFGAANNIGLRGSHSDLVLLLNSDTAVRGNAIDVLIDRLQATGAAAAGPRLIGADGRPEVSYGRMLSPTTELAQRWRQRMAASSGVLARWYTARLVSRERLVDWVSGACLLVRRDAAAAAGYFDERYFLYEEDVDFCAALRAHGGAVLFTPHATVVHLRGASRRTAGVRVDSAYDRSHLAFYQKHAPHWVPVLSWWQRIRGRGD